eukprot:13981093-Ditylum_brightwellii.AAC.1
MESTHPTLAIPSPFLTPSDCRSHHVERLHLPSSRRNLDEQHGVSSSQHCSLVRHQPPRNQ